MLLQAYPEAASCANSSDEYPLHIALWEHAPEAVVRMLLQAYPEAELPKWMAETLDIIAPLGDAVQGMMARKLIKPDSSVTMLVRCVDQT